MEKDSHYFIVGIFVTASLLAFTFFIIWLAGTHDSRKYKNYTVYFHDPVSGLKNSAAVQYRGIDVGRVTDIRLSSRNQLIKVDIEIDSSTPIAQSSEASLATLGVTGIVYIELTTSEGDTAPPSHPAGEEYPIINGRGTQLSKLFQDIPAISKQILTLTNKLNTVFDEKSIESLHGTIANVHEMSDRMNTLLSDENLSSTTAALQGFSQTSQNVNDLVVRFNKTADDIDQAIGSLNSILNDNKADINRFTGSGLDQITEMSRETKDMARSIRRLADRLEQDPSQLLYQPNYRGVELKNER